MPCSGQSPDKDHSWPRASSDGTRKDIGADGAGDGTETQTRTWGRSQAGSRGHLNVLRAQVQGHPSALPWEKPGIAQDPAGAMTATYLEPQPGRVQALPAPWTQGAQTYETWVLPTSCTDAAPHPTVPPCPHLGSDTRDLFKLCCKCNKPSPVPPHDLSWCLGIPPLCKPTLEPGGVCHRLSPQRSRSITPSPGTVGLVLLGEKAGRGEQKQVLTLCLSR